MHSISSKEIGVELGPVPSAQVEFEGGTSSSTFRYRVSSDYCILGVLLKVWAKKCTSEQSPEEWRKQVEKKLEQTPVALLWWRSVTCNEADTSHHV